MDPSPRPAAPAAPRQSPAAAAKSLFPTDSDTHLLDRVNAIYKHRSVIVAVFTLVMLAVAVRTYTTTPMYRATTSVLIEDERAATVAGFNTTTSDNYQDPEPYYQTQLRILTGRELASKAVVKLRLETMPEFNGQGPKRTGLASVLQTMKRQVMSTLRTVLGTQEPAPAPVAVPTTADLVNAFLGTVSVDQVRGSRLVNVSVRPRSGIRGASGDTLREYVSSISSQDASTRRA